jgi:cytochrome c oxidase cbb3-type subunit 3
MSDPDLSKDPRDSRFGGKKVTAGDEKLLDHNYDGIQELDNPLPSWWVWLFYISIAFSAVYFVYFTFFVKTAGERADLKVAALRKVEAPSGAGAAAGSGASAGSAPASSGPGGAAAPVFTEDSATREAGKKVFDAKCAVCHAPDGGGLIGPNMTDNYWLHGKGTLEDIYRTTVNGVPEKGMIAWGPLLSDDEIRAVTVYMKSLQGTTPATPKAPQGEPV